MNTLESLSIPELSRARRVIRKRMTTENNPKLPAMLSAVNGRRAELLSQKSDDEAYAIALTS